MKKYLQHRIQSVANWFGYRIISNAKIEPPGHLILSDAAKHTIEDICGSLLNDFIMIHGAIPRTGTNYLSRLISLHADVIAYPNRTWEVPVLACNEQWIRLQNRFFNLYPRNRDNMGLNDIIGVSVASIFRLAAYQMEKQKTLLLKSPYITSATWFHDIVPQGKLVLINRDGRDAVESTVNTWPNISFSEACRRWVKGSNEMSSILREDREKNKDTFFVRFEDIVTNPAKVMKHLIPLLGLKLDDYPFEQIGTLPVSGSSQISKKKGVVTWNPVKKSKMFNPVGKWKGWDHKKKKIFKQVAGQTLLKSGYCNDLYW